MNKSMVMVGLALATALSVQAAETSGMKMEGTKTEEAPAKAPVNHTTGVVKELDAAKGTITLAHQPVPTLKWPAMTMAFRISADKAKGIEVGQKVEFEFETKGMAATITKIAVIR